MSERELLLTENEYVHIIDNNTGQIRLIEGAFRGTLDANEALYNIITSKINLTRDTYVIIKNPIVEGEQKFGEKIQIKGPCTFSLKPFELLDRGVRTSKSLSDTQGIYIKDTLTGEIRLEMGPQEVFLGPYEEFFEKSLSEVELQALKINTDSQPLFNNDITPYAIRIELNEDEVVQLCDDANIRIEKGPKSIFLEPFEFAKYVHLSGNTPKQPGIVRTGIIRIGPDFLSDILQVRTKDNASLKMFVRYKWRFRIHGKNLDMLFIIRDFIGYAAETIGSEIRELASKYNFEEFHENTLSILKENILPNDQPRVFENGFEIYSIDVREITPVDPDIANKLNAAISNNMDVYVKKIQQNAELDAQRQKIEGEKAIESERTELIELKIQNYREERIEKAKLYADSELIKANYEADAILNKQKTKSEAASKRISEMITMLNSEESENYLKLASLAKLSNVRETIIVPQETKLLVPLSKNTESTTILDEMDILEGLEELED